MGKHKPQRRDEGVFQDGSCVSGGDRRSSPVQDRSLRKSAPACPKPWTVLLEQPTPGWCAPPNRDVSPERQRQEAPQTRNPTLERSQRTGAKQRPTRQGVRGSRLRNEESTELQETTPEREREEEMSPRVGPCATGAAKPGDVWEISSRYKKIEECGGRRGPRR